MVVGVSGLVLSGVLAISPLQAQYNREIRNDLAQCRKGGGPAVLIGISGIKSSTGNLRVQSYRATKDDWLVRGRWLSRIEVPARAGTMTFCLPVPSSGSYAIAVRHDVNGNGSTDLRTDGGGMSNNPSINIFNLGKPHFSKTAVSVGDDVRSISIVMRYM